MKGIQFCGFVAALALAAGIVAPAADAAVTSITSTATSGLHAEPARVAPEPMASDHFVFVNRGHVYKSAAFDATSGALATSGTNVPGIPSYLLGGQVIENANDNRTAVGYSLTINVDTPSYVYLLLDNRLDGTANNNAKTNTTDPNLGGKLAWVQTWTRMDTDLSPGDRADYLAIDEGGSGTNPTNRVAPSGDTLGLNQFYAIYRNQTDSTITLGTQEITGNMYGVVVVPVPEPGTIGLALTGAAALLRRRAKR